MGYKQQAVTATIINNTEWTLLNGSDLKFDHYSVYERSGELAIQISRVQNPGTYYQTVPASTEYSEEITHEGGVYAKTESASSAIIEFESKTR